MAGKSSWMFSCMVYFFQCAPAGEEMIIKTMPYVHLHIKKVSIPEADDYSE
jgi:hypothetical protein